jgi:tRNA dimethylallyltransferase
MGPTASGKTDLAVRLSEHLATDIISVDSAQVYRGMDIGTAKPEADVLALAPHRLIDIRDPAESYSVAEFTADARRDIAEITALGRVPVLVGGTMLYFRVLLEGMAVLPPADPEIRAQIMAQAAAEGWPYMHNLLLEVDPITAARLHPNHSQRIARALEVFRITSLPLSELIARQRSDRGHTPRLATDYQVEQLTLIPPDRALYHQLIERRFNNMLSAGLVEEVEQLFARGDLSADMPSLRAVGYRQVWAYLAGEYGYDEMVEKAIAATRKLAKRQLTWLRRWPDTTCLNKLTGPSGRPAESFAEKSGEADQIFTNVLNYLKKASIYSTEDN